MCSDEVNRFVELISAAYQNFRLTTSEGDPCHAYLEEAIDLPNPIFQRYNGALNRRDINNLLRID